MSPPYLSPSSGVQSWVRPHGRAASLLLLAVSVALGSLGQVLLKAGAARSAGPTLPAALMPALTDPLVMGGLVAYGLSSLLWLLVLSRVNLSVAYPLAGTSYLIVVAAGALRGEQVSERHWLGVLLIVVGVSAIGSIEARGRVRSGP